MVQVQIGKPCRLVFPAFANWPPLFWASSIASRCTFGIGAVATHSSPAGSLHVSHVVIPQPTTNKYLYFLRDLTNAVPSVSFGQKFELCLGFSHCVLVRPNKMPVPFLPRQNPRNLNFLQAKTLVTRLFFLFILSLSFPSRYLRPDSNRRSAARLLRANKTISSAYRTSFTPRRSISWSNSFR